MNLNMSGLTPAAAKEAPPQPQKEVALKVAASEVKNVRIRSADSEGKMIEISKPVFDTLLNTATFNIEIFNEIPEAQRPAVLKDFTEALKKYKPSTPELQKELTNIDFKDKAKVKKLAEDFLIHGGGEALLSTFKVMEWEASLLHGASKARFEGKDPKSAKKNNEEDIVYQDPKTGQLTTEKVDSSHWWNRMFSGKDVRGEKKLTISQTIATGAGSQIIDANDIAYLDKCGWVNGTNIQTSENRGILFQRIYSVAQARSEIFSETGLTTSEVNQRLNFTDRNGTLKTVGKTAHLIGEVAGGYLPAEFAAEAHTITEKIKTTTLEKLEKLKKEKTKERIGDQLTNRIKDLEKVKVMLPEEIKAAEGVIDQRLKEIDGKEALFTRQKLLPGVIQEAQKAYDEAESKLTEQVGNIVNLPGEVINLAVLEAWSDPTSSEGFLSLGVRLKKLKAEKLRIDGLITGLNASITTERSGRPSAADLRMGDATKVTDPDGNIVETIPSPVDARVTAEYDRSVDRENNYRGEIGDLKNKILVDEFEDGMSLDKLIVDIESRYDRRKQVVDEDTITKNLINEYREKKRLLEQKNSELADLPGKIDDIRANPVETDIEVEARLKKDYEKLTEERMNVGKSNTNNQREASALSLIKEIIIDQSKNADLEQRLIEQESGVYNAPSDVLEVSPELKDYPPVVLHAVRLMFGPEALSSAGESDLYKQTKALLESKWYVKIIVEQIEDQNGIAGAAQEVNFGADRVPGGINEELTMDQLVALTPNAKPIRLLNKNSVNATTVRNILDEIRKSALGYI